MKEISLAQLKFVDWNVISIGFKKISSTFGKTYFYYHNNKLYAENLNLFERIFRKCFGYKDKFCRKNLWDYLKDRNIVKDPHLPSKDKFRKVVGDALGNLTENIEDLVDLHNGAKLKELLDNKVIEVNDIVQGSIQKQLDGERIIGKTPLQITIDAHDSVTALELLKKGADPSKTGDILVSNGNTYLSGSPLRKAAEAQNEKIFTALLDHNAEDNSDYTFLGTTLLHVAISKKTIHAQAKLNIVKKLIELSKDINHADKAKQTPLYCALINYYEESHPENREILLALLNKGAKTTTDDLLVLLEGFKFLPPKNYDHNKGDSYDGHSKKKSTDAELAKLLIKNGAVVTLECLRAALRPEPNRESIPTQLFKYLLEQVKLTKEQIHEEDKNGYSLFVLAVFYGNVEILEALFQICQVLPKEDDLLARVISWDNGNINADDKAKILFLMDAGAKATAKDLKVFIEKVKGSFEEIDQQILDEFLDQGLIPTQVDVKNAIIRNPKEKILHLNIFKKLFEALPILNASEQEDFLSKAIYAQNREVLEYLLSKGCKKEAALKIALKAKADNETESKVWASNLDPLIALLN